MTISAGMPMRARRRLLEGAMSKTLRRGLQVEVEIDQRRGHVFHRREALVEGARGDQPPQQVLGDRRAGVGMHGEAAAGPPGRSSQCS